MTGRRGLHMAVGLVWLLAASICSGHLILNEGDIQRAEEIALQAHMEEGNVATGGSLPRRSLLGVKGEGWEEGSVLNQDEEMLDSSAPATTQGKGFKIPFYPGNSTVFDPVKSKSFRVVRERERERERERGRPPASHALQSLHTANPGCEC